jgi:endonuclease YncB( thermonuclease family)
MIRRATILLPLMIVVAGAAVAETRRNPEIVDRGAVRDVVDGDTVVLDGGTQVRLVGIQAPKLPLGRPGFRPWPLAEESKALLETLTLGKSLRLSYGGRRIDRHGRLLAHLEDAEGRWIQGEMLSAGLARVYSFADNRSRISDMLALERKARATALGIWSKSYYSVRSATETPNFIDTFQIVEGRVVSAAVVRRRGYLNFGIDWRRDFTVTVAPRDRRLFDRAGLAIAAFEGKRVRVRGWLKSFNGPMIEATHPEQIELLTE